MILRHALYLLIINIYELKKIRTARTKFWKNSNLKIQMLFIEQVKKFLDWLDSCNKFFKKKTFFSAGGFLKASSLRNSFDSSQNSLKRNLLGSLCARECSGAEVSCCGKVVELSTSNQGVAEFISLPKSTNAHLIKRVWYAHNFYKVIQMAKWPLIWHKTYF